MIDRLTRFCLEQKLVVLLVTAVVITWGVLVAPFDWQMEGLPRDPVPVDAIPDIGENQQIVFTEWMGRSPQDIDDQVSYPLTVSLLGIPGVRSVRSYSIFGFSTIYVIFEDGVDFYWSRSRIVEKLNSLPPGTLPEGLSPALGPDATALGQVFWYTLEGRDPEGNPTGGWGLEELRSAQDWTVRYALLGADGVAEVASIGGFVQEYQVDVDPDAMRAFGVTLDQVFAAVRNGNIDVGARTIEVNSAEYIVRGLGFVESVTDLELIAVASRGDVPVLIRDVANVTLGPAGRRGALDVGGAEAVGGIVVTRYGDNPLRVIRNVKAKIAAIAAGLPRKVLADGTESQVTVVPFYDRSGLIGETLETLESALIEEILVTIIVVVIMIMHLRSSLLVSGLLPLAVLMTFVGMKLFGVDANIVALSGIAIAVGTIVDMGIVLCENILHRLDRAGPDESRLEVIHGATTEVGGAVLTAVLTTIVGFLPVFAMEGAEGKLFRPLAYTKTFALIASIILTLTILPPLAHLLFTQRARSGLARRTFGAMLVVLGVVFLARGWALAGVVAAAFGAWEIARPWIPEATQRIVRWSTNLVIVAVVLVFLVRAWEPLGPELGGFRNGVFTVVLLGSVLLTLWLFRLVYPAILRWAMRNKPVVLLAPMVLVVCGATIWLGFDRTFGWLPESVRSRKAVTDIAHAVPGLGKEFMPSLDEGSFLYMPTTTAHASIGEALDVLAKLDMAIAGVPEVDRVVGKIGRAETPLDPAPISMVETIITYRPEFRRDDDGTLVRQWRDHVRTPDDIWAEIVKAAELPGTTSAPKLQPIETRIVMLQSGFRATMGIKVYGPDLATIEAFGLELEQLLRDVPMLEPATVYADRIIGKPYLEIAIDRERIARYGISVRAVQDVIEVAIGGRQLTTTVEGRERYPVRVRYMRELRDSIESLGSILVPAPDGRQIPLTELSEMHYERGPQMIKSEDTFLVGYVLFDKRSGVAEVNAVEQARAYLEERIAAGALVVPAGVSYKFAGAYENQVRAAKKLRLILPLALVIIFLLLHLQFRSVIVSGIVFSGVFVAWSGGFVLIWLYAQPWFLDVDVFGRNLRELFQVGPVNLSVAVWVGFLALFGIATDDGVVLATLVRQTLGRDRPDTVAGIRAACVEAGTRRSRACLMTTATTILALLPVLTSTGRGSDIMVPMAIPSFGGMVAVLLSLVTVPVLYAGVEELRMKWAKRNEDPESPGWSSGQESAT